MMSIMHDRSHEILSKRVATYLHMTVAIIQMMPKFAENSKRS